MAPSYKTLWQEAQEEIAALKVKIANLRRDKDDLSAALLAQKAERTEMPQIVDLAGVARHMGVGRFTPQQWKRRDILPPVDFPEIAEPLWMVSTIKDAFAGDPYGRVWHDTPPRNPAPDEALPPAA